MPKRGKPVCWSIEVIQGDQVGLIDWLASGMGLRGLPRTQGWLRRMTSAARRQDAEERPAATVSPTRR